MNTTKIQKFIEKQKKKQADKRNDEKTREHEKALKIRQNLLNLHNYTTKDRLKIKDNSRPNNHQLNIKKIHSNNESKNQQSQLLEHVRNNLPLTNLQATHLNPKVKRQEDDDLVN